jgi:RNA polymerase sigma factor (TIGR02999 family)
MANAWMLQTPPGQTLQATALVHEVFLRLVGRDQHDWENRGHFFFAASRAMRDILVENARAKGRIKRGGDRRRVDLENLSVAVDAPGDELLALDETLKRLETEYPWEHRIVMLRFFAGMTNEETARAMGAPLRTIERDWRFARAWLHEALETYGDESGALPP